MKLAKIHLKDFKRFRDLSIEGLESTVKLVLLTGPNGCGKTSLFEAFNFWLEHIKKGAANYDPEYYERDLSAQAGGNWITVLKRIEIKFHNASAQLPTSRDRKDFYIRSAYRHEAEFTTNGLVSTDDILKAANRPQKLIQEERRVSENYRRMVAETINAVYSDDTATQQKKVVELANELIGEIRHAMRGVFDSLTLESVGKPLTSGTFRFKKGEIAGFHYKNLSGGEKAAFDLLLDFIIKRKAFDNTVYCIDEPELHMHTGLQAKLLEVLFELIPDNCQLWLSTHSIGMARKAAELYAAHPGEVAFIDFHGYDFDQEAKLTPIRPGREFWQNMFRTALDDLAELVAPKYVVFCEGGSLGESEEKNTDNTAFDASVYKTIFGDDYPSVEFVSLGSANQVEKGGEVLRRHLLLHTTPGVKCWKVIDRDSRSDEEIERLETAETYVLRRRELESYLLSDEILESLCKSLSQEEKLEELLEAKYSKPNDDIKSILGRVYHKCRKILNGMEFPGNSPKKFAQYKLAPLVKPGTKTYEELADIVLAPLRKNT